MTILYLSGTAEKHRGFLLYLLREIWGNAGFCYGPLRFLVNYIGKATDWKSNKFTVLNILNKKGLYFLFLPDRKNLNPDNPQNQNKMFPFYVGITGKSFLIRFSGKHDSLQGFDAGTVIFAYFVEMPLHVAKFYESLFLSLFDFAMNKLENNKKGPIDMETKYRHSVADGISIFKDGYDRTKRYFNDMEKIISWIADSYELVGQMHHYE